MLENFNSFTRYILKEVLELNGSRVRNIHPGVWLTAYSILIISIAFFFYWMLNWGIKNGSANLNAWGKVFSISTLQTLIFASVLKCYIRYKVLETTVKPQLQLMSIIFRQVLERNKTNCSQQEEDNAMPDLQLLHHLSPSCRLAKEEISYGELLFGADLVNKMKDTDILKWRKIDRTPIPYIVMIFLIIPILSGDILSEFVEIFFETYLISILNFTIIAHYYLYQLSVIALVLLYVFMLGILFLRYYYYVNKATEIINRKMTPRSTQAQSSDQINCVKEREYEINYDKDRNMYDIVGFNDTLGSIIEGEDDNNDNLVKCMADKLRPQSSFFSYDQIYHDDDDDDDDDNIRLDIGINDILGSGNDCDDDNDDDDDSIKLEIDVDHLTTTDEIVLYNFGALNKQEPESIPQPPISFLSWNYRIVDGRNDIDDHVGGGDNDVKHNNIVNEVGKVKKSAMQRQNTYLSSNDDIVEFNDTLEISDDHYKRKPDKLRPQSSFFSYNQIYNNDDDDDDDNIKLDIGINDILGGGDDDDNDNDEINYENIFDIVEFNDTLKNSDDLYKRKPDKLRPQSSFFSYSQIYNDDDDNIKLDIGIDDILESGDD